MKRVVLKNWVIGVLVAINLVALMIMASDAENIFIFILTHFLALGIFILNSILITKFGKKEWF